MASPASYSNITNDTYPFMEVTGRKEQPRVTALTVEFVAKPQEARRAESAIPDSLVGALKDVTGFAGCLVMVSDQEARLVTVVTLWAGEERAKRCIQHVRWINTLLAPYVDRRLRVQTMNARLPFLAMFQTEIREPDYGSRGQNKDSADETVCLA